LTKSDMSTQKRNNMADFKRECFPFVMFIFIRVEGNNEGRGRKETTWKILA